jgi:hypothetical protein
MADSDAPPPHKQVVSAVPGEGGNTVCLVWPLEWITSSPGRTADVHLVVQGDDDAVVRKARIINSRCHVLDLRDVDQGARHSVHHALGDARLAPAVRFRAADVVRLLKAGDAAGLAASIELVVPPYPEPEGGEGSG